MYPSEERRKTPDRRQDAITQRMGERIAELEEENKSLHRLADSRGEQRTALVLHIERIKDLLNGTIESNLDTAPDYDREVSQWMSDTPADSLSRCHEALAARVAHEVNRAYCQALGDNSQPSWEDAPEWQKESAAMGVAFHLANPDAGPEASHNSWSAQKLNDGWRWGEVKDPEAKTHPCLVAFEALPVAQQAKDYIFRAVVHAILIDRQGGE